MNTNIDIHLPVNHFAQFAGKDTETATIVQSTENTYLWIIRGLMACCLILFAVNVFGSLIKNGIGTAIVEGIFLAIILILIFFGIKKVFDLLIMRPCRAIRYKACLKRIEQALPGFGLNPTLNYQWHLPTPCVLALDSRAGILFIQGQATGNYRLFLQPHHILQAKIERESAIYTETTHDGSTVLFSGSGIGRVLSSKSHSKSTVVETAFLEIHYQLSEHDAPSWIAFDFGEDRREADSVLCAIQRMQASPKS